MNKRHGDSGVDPDGAQSLGTSSAEVADGVLPPSHSCQTGRRYGDQHDRLVHRGSEADRCGEEVTEDPQQTELAFFLELREHCPKRPFVDP